MRLGKPTRTPRRAGGSSRGPSWVMTTRRRACPWRSGGFTRRGRKGEITNIGCRRASNSVMSSFLRLPLRPLLPLPPRTAPASRSSTSSSCNPIGRRDRLGADHDGPQAATSTRRRSASHGTSSPAIPSSRGRRGAAPRLSRGDDSGTIRFARALGICWPLRTPGKEC
jgi:hypothetical protein